MSRSLSPDSVAGGASSPTDSMEDEMVPESLLNQAALTTAKYVSCEDMEQYNEHLDEAMLEKVAFLACPQDINLIKVIANVSLRDDKTWQWGEDYYAEKKVSDMRQVGFMVTAVVGHYNVSFTFENQQITSTSCESCTNKLWCSHIIAAVLHRIRNADTVPVHAPVTETLSTLDRDQLQKLLQYAIDEDPAGVLGKVFRRIDELRDAKSEINETPGLPDPTFGIGSDATPTWDLTIDELSGSFKSACQKAVTDFPCSFEESRIRDSWWYKRFMQRVIDSVQIGLIEAAGQILITLVTEATNVALSKPANVTKRYTYLLKTIERMCSLYILEFTGQARSDLIVLCQNLNKALKVHSSQSSWAELPPTSLLFPFESVDEPGIMNAKQTSMFYEPLCASVAPDPTQEFHDLISGKVQPVKSKYNEPLPLMILRFESLRLWNNSECVHRKLLTLGTVILRKLLQATQQLTILNQQDSLETESVPKAELKKRRKTMDDMETGIPLKSMKSLPSMGVEGRNLAKVSKDTIIVGTETAIASAENMDCSSESDFVDTDEERDLFVEISDLMAGAPKLDKFEKSDMEVTNVAIRLRLLLDPLGKSLLQNDAVVLAKEMLSFCISHICYYMYQIKRFHSYLNEASREVFALATLRALELSRYRVESCERNEINKEDHSALQYIEQKLFDCYKEHIDKLIQPSVSAGLERMYMKKLCCCNTHGVCFFDNVIPLPLIVFLVKRELQDPVRQDGKMQALSMCLYTLCHSNKPFYYYEPVSHSDNYNEYCDLYRLWTKSFKDIVTLFLDHIKDLPERNFYLTKSLEHYSNVKDGKALYNLWDKVRKFPLGGLSEETLIALLKFLLNCIKFHNMNDTRTFKYYNYVFRDMMESICEKLGSKFTSHVLHSWEELVKFYDSDQLTSLVTKMTTFITQDSPVTESMLTSITAYFSGAFEHSVNACLLLKLIEKDDRSLGKAFQVIQEHSDNFTTSALLDVAEKNMDLQSTRVRRQSGKIFTNYAEKIIRIALQRIEEENKSATPDTSSYSDRGYSYTIFAKKPDPHIQWVFQAFVKGTAKGTVTCRQFTDIVSLVREAYVEDLQTIISLLSTVEKQKPLLAKCKSMFGERVLELVRKALLKATDSLTPRYYKAFKADVDKVQGHFAKYVVDGNEHFKVLLRDIKRANKSKRKLITELQNAYDF